MCSMMGLPRKSTKGFGRPPEIVLIRVPLPAARMRHCFTLFMKHLHIEPRKICAVRPLKSENQLPLESANGTVEKLPRAVTVQVVLYVSRIGVVEQVEHSKPHLHGVLFAVKGQPELSKHLKIERIKPRESLIVSRTHE